MRFAKRITASILAAVLAACLGAPGLNDAEAPDVVLYNGKIVTVDSAFSIAQAVAIRGDRFVAVGTNDAVRRTAGPSINPGITVVAVSLDRKSTRLNSGYSAQIGRASCRERV